MFNLMILYVEEILNKIKFAEDLMVKLYVVDNRKVHFYYENVAFYQVDSGTSKSNNKVDKRLVKDGYQMLEIISE